MGAFLQTSNTRKGLSVILPDTAWHKLSDLINGQIGTAGPIPAGGVLRLKLVAPNSATAKAGANAAAVQIGAADWAGGGTPIATDYLATDGTHGEGFINCSDPAQIYVKGASADRIEVTGEW